jgi:hypothetical protein
VATTAADPSGAMRASETEVVFINSSSVMAGFADWAKAAAGRRQAKAARAIGKSRKRIRRL